MIVWDALRRAVWHLLTSPTRHYQRDLERRDAWIREARNTPTNAERDWRTLTDDLKH